MTRLFTKFVALVWLISAIVALTHDARPAPSAQSSSVVAYAPRSANRHTVK